MQGYSADLRERVIHSWQQGHTQAWLATTFALSVSTIKRYIGQYRAVGHVEAKVQSYKQPTIRDEQLAALVKQLEAHADATLEQHIRWWGEQSGQWVSQSMLWRAIERAGWTRKKDSGCQRTRHSSPLVIQRYGSDGAGEASGGSR